MSTYLCRDTSPYPIVGATHPTRTHAPMLTNLLFDAHGEFSIVNDLLYAEMIIPKEQTQLAEILDCIAQVDLRHFRMLSAILVQCGVTPQFRTLHGARTDWWSGRSLSYPKTISDALSLLCKQKRAALLAYNQAVCRCNDSGIVRLLQRICADESCHLDLLTALADGSYVSSQK